MKDFSSINVAWNCSKCKKELQLNQYIVTDTVEINDFCTTCADNSIEEKKYCKLCFQYLPVYDFYRLKMGALSTYCKNCLKDISRINYVNKKYNARI